MYKTNNNNKFYYKECPACKTSFNMNLKKCDKCNKFLVTKMKPNSNVETKICPSCNSNIVKAERKCPICTRNLDIEENLKKANKLISIRKNKEQIKNKIYIFSKDLHLTLKSTTSKHIFLYLCVFIIGSTPFAIHSNAQIKKVSFLENELEDLKQKNKKLNEDLTNSNQKIKYIQNENTSLKKSLNESKLWFELSEKKQNQLKKEIERNKKK